MHLSQIVTYYYSTQGGQYSPELQAWINAGNAEGYTIPTSDVLSAIDALLATELETGTISSRLRSGYIMHAGSKGMAMLDLKGQYNLSEIVSVQFTDGQGCKSDGTSYFSQPFKSDAFAGNQLTFVQYVSEDNSTFAIMASHGFRVNTSTVTSQLQPFRGAAVGRAASHAATINFTNANHKGLYVQTRDTDNTIIYKDGTKTTGATVMTTPNISINRTILAVNDTDAGFNAQLHYTRNVSCDFIFDFFTDADELAFRTAFNTYKTAVGLP